MPCQPTRLWIVLSRRHPAHSNLTAPTIAAGRALRAHAAACRAAAAGSYPALGAGDDETLSGCSLDVGSLLQLMPPPEADLLMQQDGDGDDRSFDDDDADGPDWELDELQQQLERGLEAGSCGPALMRVRPRWRSFVALGDAQHSGNACSPCTHPVHA